MKYIAHVFLILVGLAAAFLRWVDLVNFIDLETGFPLAGSVWLRYGAIALLVLLAAVAGFMASRRPKPMEAGSKEIGVFVLVMAVLCSVQNAVNGLLALNIGGLFGGMPMADWRGSVDGVSAGIALLGLVCAVWLFSLGAALLSKTYRLPAGGVCLGMLGNIYLYALLILRFSSNQSSYYRMDPTVSVFAAAAAIWFTTALLRAVYYPESAIGRKLYRAGLACFYLCTCFALPQAVCDFIVANGTFGAMCESIVFACFGVLGAMYARRTLGEELA